MDGMQMLLKAAGFDPQEFQRFVSGMRETLQKFNADLELLKQGQQHISQEIQRLNIARDDARVLIEDNSDGRKDR